MRPLAQRFGERRDEVVQSVTARMWSAAGFPAEEPSLALDLPDDLFDEPHALGWLHQYLAETERQASFARHTGAEAKHRSATVSTQLFTPRWIADWLVAECLGVAGANADVLDPACGAGQMLLAAAAAKIERGVDPRDAFTALYGVELDPVAADVCRTTLKIAAARALQRRDRQLEAQIDANIAVGDGLFDELDARDIVVTNPPYMGARSMPEGLKASLKTRFPASFHDLYLAFVERCSELTQEACGILAQQTLWYLGRFETLRRDLLRRGALTAVTHLGHGAFSALTGEKATVMAWVWTPHGNASTRFYDLREMPSPADKRRGLVDAVPTVRGVDRFGIIPGAPLAFWLPDALVETFRRGPSLGEIAEVPGTQNKTGDNRRFVRRAADVDPTEIRHAELLHDGPSDARWVYYSKGGRYAPWWGNWDWVVDWSPEARRFYAENRTSNLCGREYWFREGLCYSDFGGRTFNARWMPRGCLFDMAGPAIFVEDDDRDTLAALLVILNSSPSRMMLNALNPTLHYQVRDVRRLPIPFWNSDVVETLAPLGHELVQRAREKRPLEELEAAADRTVRMLYELR